jgi:hypothetical protein
VWGFIGGLFSGLLAKVLMLLGVYRAGQLAERNNELERDLERASEAQRAEDAVRRLGDDVLNERLRPFSRPKS